MSDKIFVEVKKQTEPMGICLGLSDYKKFVEIANVIPKTYASLQKEKIN